MTMTSIPHLAHLVKKSRWSELEEAWTERMASDPDPAPALQAVEAAARRKELPRCVPFVKEQAELLVAADRADDAALLLGETMLLGGSPGELGPLLYRAAEAAYGQQEFWEAYVEISDLRENTPDLRGAWRWFQKLLGLQPGRVVYHAKGWGLAKIEDIDHGAREAKVRFTSGRVDRFPFKTCVEIFEFLDENDLRCLRVTDPDELARRLKEEPLEVLRWIVERNGGKSTQAGIKLAMSTLGIEGAKFTAWWRRAKKAAEGSEWFELSGPSNRVQVRLLDVAADPVEGMRRQLKRAKSLSEALTRVRALVAGGNTDAAVVAVGVETLEELVQDVDHEQPQRLATWLFLREQNGETPEELRRTLAEAAEHEAPEDPSKPSELWQLLQSVPGSREQERMLELLPEILGEDWLDHCAVNLHHAAPGMVRALVDRLEQAKRHEELLAHYRNLLARPTRNPMLLIRLAERLDKPEYEKNLPPRLRRVQCLRQLAVYIERNAPGDPVLTRARARLSDALTDGEPTLLRRLLMEADIDTLRSLANMMEYGVERDIERHFTRLAVEVSPEVFRGEERPFWELEGTWTTRAGLAQREEELRLLREVKIPENAEAIGVAASYGDLSENSEWEAAIEEQRKLTNRAMELEEEIKGANLLENAALPADTVAPGTRVAYRDGAGEQHVIELVGPWDVERDDQVSYRSPIGQGLLGAQPGEARSVKLPSGESRLEVLSIEPLDL